MIQLTSGMIIYIIHLFFVYLGDLEMEIENDIARVSFDVQLKR